MNAALPGDEIRRREDEPRRRLHIRLSLGWPQTLSIGSQSQIIGEKGARAETCVRSNKSAYCPWLLVGRDAVRSASDHVLLARRPARWAFGATTLVARPIHTRKRMVSQVLSISL